MLVILMPSLCRIVGIWLALQPESCYPKNPNATANFKFGTGFFGFFMVFFFGFFAFSILANFDWLNGFLFMSVVLVGYNNFYKTFAGLFRHQVCYYAVLGLPRSHC